MNIKEIRKQNNLTQLEASKLSGIPLRTYKTYENDESKEGSIKYNYIMDKLIEYGNVDETHGILSLKDIKEKVGSALQEYNVDYVILFGSYATGKACATSDVDLVISTEISGIKFYSMAEKLRGTLKKRVDLLDLKQLENNPELLKNVLGEGIRIYEQNK